MTELEDYKSKDFRDITPEVRAEELAEYFLQDAKDDYERQRAYFYAAKCAYEIGRTHPWTSFMKVFYAKVESILTKKRI
jgi:hypothetical protein